MGSPLSDIILELHGKVGLAGWQWLFLLEGMPAVLIGVIVFFILPDSPKQAGWLSSERKSGFNIPTEPMRDDGM